MNLDMSLKLVHPSKKFETSWQAARFEFEIAQAAHLQNTGVNHLDGFLRSGRNFNNERQVPIDWVPSTDFWLVNKNRFLGFVNIRHRLNKELEAYGGHIGYAIRPSARRQGFGTQLLAVALDNAREMGLRKVLLTCHEGNVASQKIIERNGGQFQDKQASKFAKLTVLRYWIHITT